MAAAKSAAQRFPCCYRSKALSEFQEVLLKNSDVITLECEVAAR